MTTTVVNFARVFTQDKYCDILVNNIKHYQRKYQFTVFGYVIMPTHFHWIVQVNPALGHISEIVRDIKKYSAWELFDALESDKRFGLLAMFSREASSLPDQHRKFWIRRFDDEAIRNSGMLRAKLEYIHYNPVKAELVRNPEDYKYSSARNYMVGDHSILEVRTDWF